MYLPDAVYKFQATAQALPMYASNQALSCVAHEEWEPRQDQPVVDNPFGVVPAIPLRNNPSLLGGGTSDLDDAIPLNDAASKLICDMVVASEYQAYKQRVLTGVEIPSTPRRVSRSQRPN